MRLDEHTVSNTRVRKEYEESDTEKTWMANEHIQLLILNPGQNAD